MPIVQRDPAMPVASVNCHTTLRASAKVFRTSSLNGCSSVGMTGIVANAISTPCGNCSMNEEGKFLLSSFCRIAPLAVTPHIYVASDQQVVLAGMGEGSPVQSCAKKCKGPSQERFA